MMSIRLEEVINIAQYYPHTGVAKTIVIDDVRVNCTMDFGASSFESRHFIDSRFLSRLPGGPFKYCMIDPVPFCNKIISKSGSNRVEGMLMQPLEITYQFTKLRDSARVKLRLHQVLVVDKLPVPFHFSAKRLSRNPSDLVYDIFKDMMMDPLPFASETFPMEYRTHPYWTSDVHFLPWTGHDDELRRRLIVGAASGPTDVVELIPSPVVSTPSPNSKRASCPVCHFFSRPSKSVKREDARTFRAGHDHRCPDHPAHCMARDCGNIVVYTADELIHALDVNDNSTLPKTCPTCRPAAKMDISNDSERDAGNVTTVFSLRLDGTSNSSSSASQRTPDEKQEMRERRQKGQPVSNPTERQTLLPVYCGGGSVCGEQVIYTLDHAPLFCPGKPSHQCGWIYSIKCQHCKTIYPCNDICERTGQDSVRIRPAYHHMFTHHVCAACTAGLHGGVSNNYGILFH